MTVQDAPLSATYGRGNPPPPLVAKPLKHPIKWLIITALLFITGAVVTYFCIQIAAAVYYDLFETTATMNNWWHGFIPNDSIRHAVRDVGEGLLGGLGGVYTVRNRYKKLKAPGRLDRWEMRVGIPNVHDDKRLSFGWLLGLPLLVIAYAVLGFGVAFGLEELAMHVFHLHSLTWSPAPHAPLFSLRSKLVTGLLSDWPKKLVGYAAAFFFGRRPAKAVFDDLQLWLCELRVLRDQHLNNLGKWYQRYYPQRLLDRLQQRTPESPAPWYYPPTWKATFNDVKASGATNAKLHGTAPVVFIRILLFVAFLLTVQGIYVLNVIAK